MLKAFRYMVTHRDKVQVFEKEGALIVFAENAEAADEVASNYEKSLNSERSGYYSTAGVGRPQEGYEHEIKEGGFIAH